jgi:signal transduction histidine kinase
MKRIMVVDDLEDNLYLLQVLLESQGYAVESARNGAEALEKARLAPPDLVVSDILMPVMDGFTFCRQWRADIQLAHLPFVFYTATYTDPRDEKLALEIGADVFLTKPAEPDELLDVLSRLMDPAATARRTRATAPLEYGDGVLKQYNEALVRKLEHKMLALEHEVAVRAQAEAALRQNEEQLRQAQKMEALGQMAGGIAHDFNNLLTAITGYADLILSSAEPGAPGGMATPPSVLADVRGILLAAQRAGELTRQILAFSRRQTLCLAVTVLNDVVLETRPLLEHTLSASISLDFDLRDDLGPCEVDRSQMINAIVNLALNARDAMPKGGRLTIETSNVDLDEEYCSHHPDCIPGRYVTLAVSDTGTGMTREVQSRIFEPFFTTKEEGKGTGLGLSMVYGLVGQSGGYIDVHSKLDVGTTFKIYLPRVD